MGSMMGGEGELVEEDHVISSGRASRQRLLKQVHQQLVFAKQCGLGRLAEAVPRPHLLVLDAAAPVLLGQRVAGPCRVRVLIIQKH